MESNSEVAVFGGGCFWCTEAVFLEIKGVTSVASGYSGGHVENPNYYQVCGETTGHAEVVRIEFDPGQITFPELLEVFFATHDPTTLNSQGADHGFRYRSVVLHTSDAQRDQTADYIKELDAPETCPVPWSRRSPSSRRSTRQSQSIASSMRTTRPACTARSSSTPRWPRSARSSPKPCGPSGRLGNTG